MSRSRKDARRGHRVRDDEVWSRRCRKVDGASRRSTRGAWRYTYKAITHRHERRVAKRVVACQIEECLP